MTLDSESLRLCGSARRRRQPSAASAIAELVSMWAVRIELGRLQHKRRTITYDDYHHRGEAITEPVERPYLTATFLEAAKRDGLVANLEAAGFDRVHDERRHFRDWAPLPVGDGFVPLGFFVAIGRRPLMADEANMQLRMLMKVLSVRSDLVLKVLPGMLGWHVTTFHHSEHCAENCRKLLEREADYPLRFD